MTKLNQIIAVEKGVKASTKLAIDRIYHTFQKPEPFVGLVKTYRAAEEDGYALPPESKKIVAKVPSMLTALQSEWTRILDLTLTKDFTNSGATADIKVGDTVLATEVPVTTLIWLEKQLVDLHTIVTKVPVLDVAEDWTWDPNDALFRSATVETARMKKVQEFVTVAPATDKHAAQVVQVSKDVLDGYWSTTKLSAAIPIVVREQILARIEALQAAVKQAREQANMTEVTDRQMGSALLGFVFGG